AELPRRMSGDVGALEHEAACGGGEHARHQVEHRALAGTIWPDQRDDLAGTNLQIDPVDRHQSAEPLGSPLHLQQRLTGRRQRTLREWGYFPRNAATP